MLSTWNTERAQQQKQTERGGEVGEGRAVTPGTAKTARPQQTDQNHEAAAFNIF